MTPNTPILLYHHVARDRDMTPERFEAQLSWLLKEGYTVVTMDDLVESIAGQKMIAKRSIVLTFDDGYANNYNEAFPVLKKLSLKALIYLVTDRIGTDGFMTWEQVRQMKASGLITFGSHTRTHRDFVRKNEFQNLEDELIGSRQIVEEKLSVPCRHFAWPWGDYETSWLPRVQAAGYVSAATTLGGPNVPGSNPFSLRRLNVRQSSTEWLASRLRRNESSLGARVFGLTNGWDRRFKVWWNKESPYSHG